MKKEDIEKIIDSWKSHLLVGPLEGYQLEISDNVPEAFAAIALYLDSKTVRASGEVEEYYEGYRQAAVDVLEYCATSGVVLLAENGAQLTAAFQNIAQSISDLRLSL